MKKFIAFIADHNGYMGWCKERTLLSSTVTSAFGNSVDKNEMQQEMKLFEDATAKNAKNKHQSTKTHEFMIASFPLAKTKLGLIYTRVHGFSSIQAVLEDDNLI